MFDRLSLYKPLFGEAHAEEANRFPDPYVRPTSSLSQSAHDYTSDSAATVRGLSNGHLGEPQQQKPKLETASPRLKLLRARRRAAGIEAAQGEESGISFFEAENEEEEEEMGRLRELLDDEMDNLLQARMREELQRTLGQPLTEVPIVLCALWRIDGWLWNLGSTVRHDLVAGRRRCTELFHTDAQVLSAFSAAHVCFCHPRARSPDGSDIPPLSTIPLGQDDPICPDCAAHPLHVHVDGSTAHFWLCFRHVHIHACRSWSLHLCLGSVGSADLAYGSASYTVY
jgi:hypothetical protein